MKLFKSLPKNPEDFKELYALKLKIKTSELPSDILLIPELRELYLEGICEHLKIDEHSFLKLKKLSIHFPDFKDNLSEVFGLSELENLKIIETPLKKIRFPIGKRLSPLKSLTLKKTQLSELPLEISMLSMLEELSLIQNDLTTLPDSIKDLKNLKRLNLDQNKFTTFPKVILEIPHLTHLSVDGNLFSEEEKERIQREYQITVY